MYYVIEISDGDAKIAGKAIYQYETEKEAVASYHKKLGTAGDSDLYTSELVMVIDEKGKVIKRESFVNSVNDTNSQTTTTEEFPFINSEILE